MKTSTILSWKYWISKLHPPFTLSPLESQKFLKLLNTSFQRVLDREYPEVMSDKRTHVQQHIQSVLESPRISGRRTLRNSVRNHFEGHVESLSQLRFFMMRPMDHFKNQVAAGTVTVESAKMCLKAQTQLASASSHKSRPLQPFEAGSMFLEWMRSLPAVEMELISLDLELINLLTTVLNTEDNEPVIWQWIMMWQQRASNERSKRKHECIYVQTVIFRSFLENKIKTAGLNAAVDVFLRGVVEISSWSTVPSSNLNLILHQPGRFLVFQILGDSNLIPTLQLKSFIQTFSLWRPQAQVHQILLELYRRQCTNKDTARKFLAELDADGMASLEHPDPRNVLIRVHHKVAELISSGSEKEARWVKEYLRANYTALVGPWSPVASPQVRDTDLPKTQQQEAAEESSLRLLDSLSVH